MGIGIHFSNCMRHDYSDLDARGFLLSNAMIEWGVVRGEVGGRTKSKYGRLRLMEIFFGSSSTKPYLDTVNKLV